MLLCTYLVVSGGPAIEMYVYFVTRQVVVDDSGDAPVIDRILCIYKDI